jgi:hypothetical protein
MTLKDLHLGDLSAYQLVEALDELYPHRCAQPGIPMDQTFLASGRRDLVDILLTKVRKEQDGK